MVQVFSITDIGKKRQLNQDFVYTCAQKVGNLPNLFIVADGMGGHRAGDYASKKTVEYIRKRIEQSSQPDPAAMIKEAIESANTFIRELACEDETLAGMGTTAVVASITDDRLDVGNVGDSRLYVIKKDSIRQITIDHSQVEEMVRRGVIDRESAKYHPDKNIITRAVGALDYIDVDFFQVELERGDIILMCSDGLSNMLEDEEMRRIVTEGKSLEICGEQLVAAANDHGGKDNIAVILIEPFADEVTR